MLFKFDLPKDKLNDTVFDYVQNSSWSTIIQWIINSKYRTSIRLSNWLSTMDLSKIDTILSEIPDSDDYDEQVIYCLRWVKNNITYIGDTQHWGITEYWQTVEETLDSKEGDCEDGAILLYWLCRRKGVPINRLLLMCGDVDGGGHCWLAYRPIQYPLNYVFIDWCYYPNINMIPNRYFYYIRNGNSIEEYDNTSEYLDGPYNKLWFAFNELYSYPSLVYKYIG